MHTFHRLRLLNLVITPSLAILHYYTNQAIDSIHPQRNILWHFRVSLSDSGIPALIVLRILICFGGDGEIRTPVLPNFLITSTNLYSITWYLYNVKHLDQSYHYQGVGGGISQGPSQGILP